MNTGVPQCKNCWKWGHITYMCYMHGLKKMNSLRLEIKKKEPYTHSFKYINYNGKY